MAEIIINVFGSPEADKYKDGDVLQGFTNRRIKHVHAEFICHVQHSPFNSDGLRQIDSLPQHYNENVYQYKFERVSFNEILRTNLWTRAVELISNVPNASGEYINVEGYIARRIKHPRHRIFGKAGLEFWYGGGSDPSHTKLDLVWNKIEEKTNLKKTDHALFPLGSEDKKKFLALSVNDLPEEEAASYEVPVTEEYTDERGKRPSRIIRKRSYNCNWRALLPHKEVSVQDVLNPEKSIDIRDTVFSRLSIVGRKP